MIYLEVFLASDPVLVILSHFKGVFDRRQRLYWHMINKMPFLKVLFQVEAQHWGGLTLVVLMRWLIKLSPNK